MNQWIGKLFQTGHTLEYLMEMSYWDYIFLIQSINEVELKESGKPVSRNLRPIQHDALKKSKKLVKGK